MKYKKLFKHFSKNLIKNKNTNSYLIKNICALRLLKSSIISNNLIEAIRKYIVKKIKTFSTIHINIRPTFYITKKNIGARMGKGFGIFYKKVCYVKKGFNLIEFFSTHLKLIKYLLKKVKLKLPVKSIIVIKKSFFKDKKYQINY